jgi:Fe-S cluster assembly ATP-binding protein
MILNIQNLEASINNKKIIKNLNLKINEKEIHVIMGPNGSGKSTLSKIIAGHPSYSIENGTIEFLTKNLLELSPEERSHEGIFLAFQYPIEISGVTNYDFLRLAYNEKQKYLSKPEVTPLEFMGLVNVRLEQLKMSPEFLNRDLNQGFSGGEKKRNEILQMLLLEPELIILDELDSGLDIDAIRIICETIMKNLSGKTSVIVITHYPRILTYLKPNYVHIMREGKIIKTGNLELIESLEKEGYENIN